MRIDFTFTDGEVATLDVVGERSAMVNHQPDGAVVELLSFGTAVAQAAGGAEHRTSYRKRPRQGFQVEYLLDVDRRERRRFQNMMFGAQGDVLGLPLIHDATALTAAVAGDATTLPVVGTAYMDVRVGGYVVVFSDADTFDVARVDSIDATNVYLSTAVVNGYAAGATVCPLRFVRVVGPFQGSRPPMGIERLRVSFESVENDVGAPDGDLGNFELLDGLPIFDRRNVLIGGAQDEAWDAGVIVVDGEAGQVDFGTSLPHNRRTCSLGIVATTRAELWETRQFLLALRGRFGAFWLPTRAQDFTLLEAIAGNDTSMVVEDQDYQRFVDGLQHKATLRMTLVDGSKVVRTVVAAEPCEGIGEVLTVSEPWPATIQPGDVAYAEWLEPVRLVDDVVQIEHTGYGKARVATSVVTVQDVPDVSGDEDWGSIADEPSLFDEWGGIEDGDVTSFDWGEF